MNKFIFISYDFDKEQSRASFKYGFEDGRSFVETITFETADEYDEQLFDRALELAFILIGTSYYKTFPSREIDLGDLEIDEWQAKFFTRVYQEGMGQFAFENGLTRQDLAEFKPNSTEAKENEGHFVGEGVLSLQSGGKDSLLTSSLLDKKQINFTSWYLSNGLYHPIVLDRVGSRLITSVRTIDREALMRANDDGAKNGHVPVTYIVQSLALIQAILLGTNRIIVSIAHEGEEPHHQIGDLAVTHQWSKTWGAEKDFAEYVARYISDDIRIGSPLRTYSELRVAEMFVESSWEKYGYEFSSCNRFNYMQGNENSKLGWCGECPKCANSYLLFAPFLPPNELQGIFAGKDLFQDPNLTDTFKGLLGIDDVPKPFECIGEIAELRKAYHMARANGYSSLPFEVPESSFDYLKEYPAQQWAVEMLK